MKKGHFKVELQFEVDEDKVPLHLLAFYLGWNRVNICNVIFMDNNQGLKGDEVCTYKITKIERK